MQILFLSCSGAASTSRAERRTVPQPKPPVTAHASETIADPETIADLESLADPETVADPESIADPSPEPCGSQPSEPKR